MEEEYRFFNGNSIEVSNYGNVRINGRKAKQYLNQYYLCVTIDGKPVRVHTLVGRAFPEICGRWHKNYHFHHKNMDRLDNRAENIICLSPSEHQLLHRKMEGKCHKIKAYDLKGKKVGEWDSKIQAARNTGVPFRHICAILNGTERRFTAGKLYWFYANVPEEDIKGKIKEIEKEKYHGKRMRKRK